MPFIHLKAEEEKGEKEKFSLSREISFCLIKGSLCAIDL